MASSPVRIALVGLDHWYTALPLVDSLATREDATLVAICDANVARARGVARRAGVGRITTRPAELLDDPSIDAIASLISVDQNPGVCSAAARRGKHILSVKPLARTLPEATEILTAVRAAGVVFLPSESRGRLAGYYRQLKGWINEGRFGRILTARFTLWAGLPHSWHDDPDPGWFVDAGRAPGGGWIDHSIYHIDTLRWLLGTEVARASGRIGNLKYPDLPVEDYGSSTVEFADGALAMLEDTWLAAPGASRATMELVGAEGTIAYDSLTGHMSVAGPFPPFAGWVHTAPQAMHDDGLDHFLACIRGEQRPIATVEDAWRNLAACRAFYDAVTSGHAVAPAGLPGQ